VSRGGGAAAVVAAGALLFCLGLGRYALWDPDEARHAEVAREMARGHGLRALVLPTLEFEPYREKPAPFYWLLGLAFAVGGVDEAAARGVSAVAALAGLLAVYAWARRRWDVETAVAAALVLATTGGWFTLARFVNLDMALTAIVVAGVLAGLAWLERPPPRRAPVAPWLATAAATLVKGPIGAALIAGPLALALAVHRPRPAWRELGLVRGTLGVLAVVAAYWTLVAAFDPQYAGRFLTTNLRRFGVGERSPHAEPVWYYVAWLPALFLPWSLFAAGPLVRAARDPVRRPLVLWAAFVPALLTLARGKVATYALSALAPLALIVGPELWRTVRDGAAEDPRALGVGGAVAVAALGAAAAAPFVARGRLPVPLAGAALIAALALGWAAALVQALRRGRVDVVPAAVLGAALTLYPAAAWFVMPAVSAVHSDREAARLVARGEPGPVVAFAARAPSLVFYLGAGVLRTEDLDLVADLFARDEPVYLVAGHRHFARIEDRLGAHAYLWHATPRRRLWANRPPPAPQSGSR
jgi:4-amino-4-deoxy-L-arabinose transferase-like glycosyltransferase